MLLRGNKIWEKNFFGKKFEKKFWKKIFENYFSTSINYT